MLKIGVIGIGMMGNMHLNCYSILSKEFNIEIAAIADIDPEKVKEAVAKFGGKGYSSGEELIANADVDLIDITLPTYLHAEHAIMAMERGRHVMVEKPVARTAEQGEAMLAAQKKAGVQVMVGHCIRHWNGYVVLKEMIDSGKYGKVKSAVFNRLSPAPTWGWENWLRTTEKSGGCALDMHIHDVDYVRYVFGDPVSFHSDACYAGDNEPVHIVTNFRYPDKMVSMEGVWDYKGKFPFEMKYRINFEDASVTFSTLDNLVHVYTDDEEQVIDLNDDGVGSSDVGGNISDLGGYYNELKYLLSCLTNGKPVEIANLADSVESLKLVLKCIESTR